MGCLRTSRGNLPLDEIDVRATVTGLASQVELTQGFVNGHTEPLEATYIFPLPPRSAVTALRMLVGDRVVDGVLKERGEAREDYDRAITGGKRASIAEEDRPGVFTMRVGNIMPGERVTVRLTLAGQLPFEDGQATFRFPLVVAPRYIPGSPLPDGQVGTGTALDTDAVPDASRISPPVLLPGFPNPVRLSVGVDIDPAGLPLSGIESSLHTVVTEGRHVRLEPGERADRDFILRLRFGAEDAVSTSLAVLPDSSGGTFALTLVPPATARAARPRDVVLVLDRSGSMEGWKMVAARRAAARIVDTLTTVDKFAVLAFDHTVETPPDLPGGLVEANDRNRFRAVEHLAGLDARGGTEMLAPLQQAARLLGTEGDRDRVLVLVTDGQIGNEDQLLRSLSSELSGVRVHTVGIDRAVNEAFLQRLSGLGGGRCELVESEDRLDEAMQHIHRRIATPLVTGLRVTAGSLAVDPGSLAPQPLPDLFDGAPVVIGGRFTGPATGTVTVTGDGWQTTVTATPSDNTALGAVWARARIRDLEDSYVTGGQTEHEIVETSLRYGVLSRFTAFVAVDDEVVNEAGGLHQVTQPVEQPSGWASLSRSRPAMPLAAPAPELFMPRGGGYGSAPSFAEDSFALAEESEALGVMPDMMPPSPPARARRDAAPEHQTVQEFAAVELWRLQSSTETDPANRAGALRALADRIRRLMAAWTAEDEPAAARKALADLAVQLSFFGNDPADVDHRWQHAITTLESLTMNRPRRRTFWKR
ncbi:VIT domain-containing protein [Actinocrispum sp. NPDC049592]|uniref:VIT domain-containing protein n=1 Tax=Actinocrispum sp. NPDC049592 TaxID=3154835 RepID=UPI00343B2422